MTMYGDIQIFRQRPASSTRSSSVSSKTSSTPSIEKLGHYALISHVYMEARGYEVIQRNGQRISTLIGYQVPEDGLCREVFVGRLPRDILEMGLLPVMQDIGLVYKIRLMMDFSGFNRGYAYVMFLDPADANEACRRLNNTSLKDYPMHKIGVVPSLNNKSLWIGNLPARVPSDKLIAELKRVVDGIETIRLPDCSMRRGSRYAIVRFKTHDDATKARRVLCPGNVRIMNHSIRVDWAKPDRPIMCIRK